jgi:phytoene dehydrogenase-like protein
MSRSLPSETDIVVIGSGIGGLTASALLARAGYGVVVVERESRPGGYLAGFNRKGFKFDSAVHWLNQCAPGGWVHKIFTYLGGDVPQVKRLKRIRRYKSERYDWLLTDTPEALRDEWLRKYPADEKGIITFFQHAKQLGKTLTKLQSAMRSPQTMSLFERSTWGMKAGLNALPFVRFLPGTLEDRLNGYFKSKELHDLFCHERDILSCLVPIGWAYEGDYQAPPTGGSVSFVKFLMERTRSSGSEIVLRNGAARILVESGQAKGVVLDDGKTIRARHVLANCDALTVFERMLPEGLVPQKYIDKFRQAELYGSAVSLSLGLSTDPRALGFDEEMISLHKDGTTQEQAKSTDPATAGLTILAPSIRDATLAPAGKGTLTIYSSGDIRYGDNWKTEPGFKRGPAYEAFKDAHAQALIDRVEKTVAPGLSQHIEVLDLATPVTHLRYTGNKDGTIMGQVANKKNMQLGVSGNKTPVENLWLSSHWAEYGGGVPIAVKAAANTALLVMKSDRPEKFRELGTVMSQTA